MKYTKPTYEKDIVSTSDIILASVVNFGNGATLTQINEATAQVGASALDVLGLR